jgi:hypothetical protein|tara:strand:- start:54 stop:1091 length:1038 start_codon:yes stop_codon:yes gene_type:complete
MKDFPQYNTNRKNAKKGVTLIEQFVENKFGWIFRRVSQDDDFGIDGYFDVVTKEGYVTGKSLGVQIKTGDSYFSEDKGYCWIFRGEKKHLNYYLNSEFPILMLLVDLNSESIYWGEIKENTIIPSGKNWKTEIFKKNKLSINSKSEIKSLTGEVIDYLPELESKKTENGKFLKSDLIVLAVDKEEILNRNYSGFENLKKRLLSSGEMVKKLRGKISFMITGYDFDSRELYEIPEVREWIKTVIPIFKYWGYFLYMEKEFRSKGGLIVLQSCSIDLEKKKFDTKKKGYTLSFEPKQVKEFIDNIYKWLNEISDKYNIDEDMNFEQSKNIAQIVYGITDEEFENYGK